jgi:Domain of unknown function (DUF6894)
MPKYHFNTDDRADPNGIEMESLAQAKCEAIRMAGQTICQGAEAFWARAEWKMTVTDASGLILFDLLIIGTESAACGSGSRAPNVGSGRVRRGSAS